MLTQTTRTGIRALVLIALRQSDEPTSVRLVAGQLGTSPTYMAKILNLLVKGGVVRGRRGVHGGVALSRKPQSITLREIVEACQGRILGDYCSEAPDLEGVCSFHQAMTALHDAVLDVLSRWSLADLLARPCPDPEKHASVQCRMANVCPGKSTPHGAQR